MTIRVGVDGSGPSRAALKWALRRAADLGDSLVLMHVVDDEWGQLGTEYARIEEAAGAQALDDAMNDALALSPGSDMSSQLVHGSVAWSLVQGLTVEDLVVVGTHKTGYLRGRVIGTRSIVVASVSPCSVAVIPDIDLSGRRGIVVGIADGDAWPDAVRVGVDEASRTGQDVTLIHALPDSAILRADQGRDLIAAASSLAAEMARGTTIRRRVSQRLPVDALLDASHTATLLVVGASRRDPNRAGYIGSVIHDILMNINAPVLVARR